MLILLLLVVSNKTAAHAAASCVVQNCCPFDNAFAETLILLLLLQMSGRTLDSAQARANAVGSAVPSFHPHVIKSDPRIPI